MPIKSSVFEGDGRVNSPQKKEPPAKEITIPIGPEADAKLEKFILAVVEKHLRTNTPLAQAVKNLTR